MIKIERVQVFGLEAALRGMRNAKDSWNKADSLFDLPNHSGEHIDIGPNDRKLANMLANAGTDHGKFLRMIQVWVDITAMQPWWMEFDTYKIGTTKNSRSKMHKINAYPFQRDHFAHEGIELVPYANDHFDRTIEICERLRQDYNATGEYKYWRALIEILPEGYELKATVNLNYAVLRDIFQPGRRKYHKVYEWRQFCERMEELPCSFLFADQGEKHHE